MSSGLYLRQYLAPPATQLALAAEPLLYEAIASHARVCAGPHRAISVEGSRRIVKFAFEYARTNKRKKVTARRSMVDRWFST